MHNWDEIRTWPDYQTALKLVPAAQRHSFTTYALPAMAHALGDRLTPEMMNQFTTALKLVPKKERDYFTTFVFPDMARALGDRLTPEMLAQFTAALELVPQAERNYFTKFVFPDMAHALGDRLTPEMMNQFTTALKLVPAAQRHSFTKYAFPAMARALGDRLTPEIIVPLTEQFTTALELVPEANRYDFTNFAFPAMARALGDRLTPEMIVPKTKEFLNYQNAFEQNKTIENDNEKTVGFEVEPWVGQSEGGTVEFRSPPMKDVNEAMSRLRSLAPLTAWDQESPISTLHVNFGLTPVQANRYKANLANIKYVMKSMMILSNDPARFKSYKWLENGFLRDDITPIGSQTARLEYKGFDLSRGTDLAMVRLAIQALWKMLDNPSLAKDLRKGFEQIWQGLGADPFTNEIPVRFFGTTVKTPKPGMWGCPTSASVLGCIVDQRPLVREMVAQILKDGKLKAPADYQPDGEENFNLPNVRRAANGLSLDERAAMHPFARTAAACPEPT